MKRQGLYFAAVAGLALALGTSSAVAQKKYDPGASDTEIKIGNINPYSGPASAYGLIGKRLERRLRTQRAVTNVVQRGVLRLYGGFPGAGGIELVALAHWRPSSVGSGRERGVSPAQRVAVARGRNLGRAVSPRRKG